jgi:hypothetical protein
MNADFFNGQKELDTEIHRAGTEFHRERFLERIGEITVRRNWTQRYTEQVRRFTERDSWRELER